MYKGQKHILACLNKNGHRMGINKNYNIMWIRGIEILVTRI